MILAPPTSQKADVRPISFILDDQATGTPPVSLNLALRPEDLTRGDPSRLNVQQTLGGAWGDNFGPGVPTINISGHTGWRPAAGTGEDGMARFHSLKNLVFDQWHTLRANAVQTGRDPDLVQLIFADALDEFTVVVAPGQFVLRRSRSRPLLFQYQIHMFVLDQNVDAMRYVSALGLGVNASILQQTGLESLTASVNEITGQINNVRGWIDSTLVKPVQSFMNQTARLYGAVRGMIASANGVAGSLISVAQMSAQAGINLFRTVAAVESIPQQVKADLMAVGGAYSNIYCVLHNALRQQIYYEDYDPLFGSSNCSSTAGGRPISSLAGTNPFYSAVPTLQPLPVSLTSSAQSGLSTLAANDPVLSPLSTPALRAAVSDIASGMAVAA